LSFVVCPRFEERRGRARQHKAQTQSQTHKHKNPQPQKQQAKQHGEKNGQEQGQESFVVWLCVALGGWYMVQYSWEYTYTARPLDSPVGRLHNTCMRAF
jgi:hypothetical protein